MTQQETRGVIDVNHYRALVREFNRYKKEQTQRCERLDNKIDKLQDQVNRNTAAIHPLVEAWNDAKGVIKVSGYIGNFFAWLGKFAIVGWVVVFIKDTFFE
ncbi:MAG: hypothetical protein DBP02_15150 [gamma proteobacterium symbiont of Ctena orbiculata]|nr:MAG: hypothetical protein DBP02_15150 [gamma proteobacterium symbiont of Ctena orbiculata]